MFLFAIGVKIEDAVVLKEATDYRAHADVFRQPLVTPGRSEHTPRTIRSMVTPAALASYRALMISGSSSEFILAMMRALRRSIVLPRLRRG
jgi:hypothetical protein